MSEGKHSNDSIRNLLNNMENGEDKGDNNENVSIQENQDKISFPSSANNNNPENNQQVPNNNEENPNNIINVNHQQNNGNANPIIRENQINENILNNNHNDETQNNFNIFQGFPGNLSTNSHKELGEKIDSLGDKLNKVEENVTGIKMIQVK